MKRLCDVDGLTTTSKEEIPMAGRVIPIAIPDIQHPRILIDVTYGITTSSAQTKYAEKQKSFVTFYVKKLSETG